MAKIVIDCVNPNDFSQVIDAAERAAGSCTITYAKQHLEMVDAGTSKSVSESSRIISEDSDESPQAVRRKIQRGIDEGAHVGQDSQPETEPDSDNSHFRTSFTGENEWYTPDKYIESVRRVLGEIDLDPATSELAQKTIKAGSYYTKEADGLLHAWRGRVWLNPPYAQPLIYEFIEKLVSDVENKNVLEAILLTHNYTDTAWFHLAESAAALICFTRGRVKFEDASGRVAAPTQGSAFFYFGRCPEKFKEVFSQYGFIR